MALKFDMSKDSWRDAYMAGQGSLAGTPQDQAFIAGENVGTALGMGGDYYKKHITKIGKEYQRYLKNEIEAKKDGKKGLWASMQPTLTFEQFRTNKKMDDKRDKEWGGYKGKWNDDITEAYKRTEAYKEKYPKGDQPSEKDIKNWAFTDEGNLYVQGLKDTEAAIKQRDKQGRRSTFYQDIDEGKGFLGKILKNFIGKGDLVSGTGVRPEKMTALKKVLGKYESGEISKFFDYNTNYKEQLKNMFDDDPAILAAYEAFKANPEEWNKKYGHQKHSHLGKSSLPGFMAGIENYMEQSQDPNWTSPPIQGYKATLGEGALGLGRGFLDAIGLGERDALSYILAPKKAGLFGFKKDWKGDPVDALTKSDLTSKWGGLNKMYQLGALSPGRYRSPRGGGPLMNLAFPEIATAMKNKELSRAIGTHGPQVEKLYGLAAGGGAPGPLESLMLDITGRYPGQFLYPDKGKGRAETARKYR